MSRTWIAAGGKAGAGKDFILMKLVRYHAGQNGLFAIAGFGDLVRAELLGLGVIGPTRREQQVHGQKRRQENKDYWTYRAIQWADSLPYGTVVGFSGVRFENEIYTLKYGGFRVGLVEAPESVRRQRLTARDGRSWTEEELNDVTETSLDTIPRSLWDFVWDNS